MREDDAAEGEGGLRPDGSKGIGGATTLACVREGVDVVICARGEPDLKAVAKEVEEAG